MSWLLARPERLDLPVVCLAALAAGIEKPRRTGNARRADAFDDWMGELLADFEDRILLNDVPAAREAGRLADNAGAIGRPPGFADLAIAAIAIANDMTVLTRNLRHFAPLGVPAHDPYALLPDQVRAPPPRARSRPRPSGSPP